MSARRVTTHLQAMSERFSEPGASDRLSLDQKTLEALLALLSHSLQATITAHQVKRRLFRSPQADGEEATDFGENPRNGSFATTSCELEGAFSAQQVVRLVTDVLEMPTELMLVRADQRAAPPWTFYPDLPALFFSRRTSCFGAFRSIASTATSWS